MLDFIQIFLPTVTVIGSVAASTVIAYAMITNAKGMEQ